LWLSIPTPGVPGPITGVKDMSEEGVKCLCFVSIPIYEVTYITK